MIIVSVWVCYNTTEITIVFYGQIFMKKSKKFKIQIFENIENFENYVNLKIFKNFKILKI